MFECLLEDISERLVDISTVENVESPSVALFVVTSSWLETAIRAGVPLGLLLTKDQHSAVGLLDSVQ